MEEEEKKEIELFMEEQDIDDSNFSIITDIQEGHALSPKTNFNKEGLPILPLRNMLLFPCTLLPVSIGRKSSLSLVDAMENNGCIGVFCQKDPNIEVPDIDDLHNVGTVAKIIKSFKLPDGSRTAILQGYQKISLKEITQFAPYHKGNVEEVQEVEYPMDAEFMSLLENCKDIAMKIAGYNNNNNIKFTVPNIDNEQILVNFLSANIKISHEERLEIFNTSSVKERAFLLMKILDREIQFAELNEKIRNKTHNELNKQQREYYLQMKMKNIQEELGETPQEQEAKELKEKAANKNWPKEISDIFGKELQKLSRINSQSPDYHVQLTYLQTLVSLPWGEYTKDNLNIANARKTLDRDHYGLDKVKERILEHLAVMKMRGDLRSPIICLYGPPGVGKTSLGKSIAKALKRNYIRMSLGGVHDESEIRGHRKTYIGAMPGRIIKSIAKAGSDNPVFILDEIDKVGRISMQGDPSAALLEVLDPEQNNTFHDNFLDVDYDLSKVMFIATANSLSGIPAPLLDRMELIEVNGYLTEEKVEIARRHLIPKEKEANGISSSKANISKAAIEAIIEDYTRESGVRALEKKIGKVFRRLACSKALDSKFEFGTVKPDDLASLLGVKEFSRDKYQGNDYAGVVTGLAWTSAGGEILFVETSVSRGKGEKLTLTGNLGDVMKESATLAVEYVKAHAAELGIPYEVFEKWNIHIHVPEGATPKDGPSAGITMVTALASALTQRKVKQNLAMTGEITLRGKVLPVGGIKEKILAAKRAGIKEIVICEENRRNIEIIPEMYVQGLTFHYVTDMKEVLDIALLDERVNNPINFMA